MYKISIIMPIFNVEKYIERSFNSILNQTMDLNDIEVIMVDDCSTDSTQNIVKKYEEKYPNFKAVYHEKNSGGCAVPRNSGFEIATGKYIMFLDPDDEFALDMCETLYNKIENSDAEIVKCNHELINPILSRVDYQYDKSLLEIKIDCKKDLPPDSVSVCNCIHNHEFLKNNNLKFLELKNSEDLVFSIAEFFNANTMIFLNNYAGYKYYTNEEISHQSKPTDEKLEALVEGYLITQEIIKKQNRTEIYYKLFSKRCSEFFIRLLNYAGRNKKQHFIKFYEFEKRLDCTLNFEFMWMNIVNKFIVKNHISTAILVFDIFNFIRKTPLVNIYRKTIS